MLGSSLLPIPNDHFEISLSLNVISWRHDLLNRRVWPLFLWSETGALRGGTLCVLKEALKKRYRTGKSISVAVRYLVSHFRNPVKILETVLLKGNFREINRIIMFVFSYNHVLH